MSAADKIIAVLILLTGSRLIFLDSFNEKSMEIEIAFYDKEGNIIDSIWLNKKDFKQ